MIAPLGLCKVKDHTIKLKIIDYSKSVDSKSSTLLSASIRAFCWSWASYTMPTNLRLVLCELTVTGLELAPSDTELAKFRDLSTSAATLGSVCFIICQFRLLRFRI